MGQASAERGEPWLSLFAPDEMAALLAGCGFGSARDVSQREMIPAGLWDRPDGLQPAELSHIAHAVVAPADHAGPGVAVGDSSAVRDIDGLMHERGA